MVVLFYRPMAKGIMGLLRDRPTLDMDSKAELQVGLMDVTNKPLRHCRSCKQQDLFYFKRELSFFTKSCQLSEKMDVFSQCFATWL